MKKQTRQTKQMCFFIDMELDEELRKMVFTTRETKASIINKAISREIHLWKERDEKTK